MTALTFCQECRILMCNKCDKSHSDLFKNHHIYKLDKDIKDIFTEFCKEKDHIIELRYFLKHIIYYVVQNVSQN